MIIGMDEITIRAWGQREEKVYASPREKGKK